MDLVNSQAQDTSRLTPQQLRAISDALDRTEPAGGNGKNRRQHKRRAFETLKAVTLEVHEPGAPTSEFLVIPLDLSASGMSVLHGVFMNAGTTCVVVLPTNDSGHPKMPGVVVRCRHIAGRVHEIGIKFELQRTADDACESAVSRETTGASERPGDREARELLINLAKHLQAQTQQGVRRAGLSEIAKQISDACERLGR